MAQKIWPNGFNGQEANIYVYELNVSTNTEWILGKYGSDIHIPLKRNCNNLTVLRSVFQFVQFFGLLLKSHQL